MSKRVLMVATVPSMIGQFNMNNIRILQDLRYEVDVAADFTDTSFWPTERIDRFRKELAELNVKTFQLDFSRNVFKLNRHIKAYKETIKLINERMYSFIHTHTPVASAIVRLAANKTGTRVIYTAHGFHFYDGAPIKNWVIFYPIEKYLSKYTDVLITINREDYKRAKEKFKVKKISYVPGVGINLNGIENLVTDYSSLRNQLGLKSNEKMIISVGELSTRKNHESVIRALGMMNNKKTIHYYICGKGVLKNELETLAKKMDISDNVHFLGYRNDVVELLKSCDVFIFPSLQEGLPVALMEAMACKCHILCSRIRGNVDLIANDNFLFDPKSPLDISKKIQYLLADVSSTEITYDMNEYSSLNITKIMKKLYSNMEG